MSYDRNKVIMVCNTCGSKWEKKRYCPYTGIVHGQGWNYKCPICQTDMIEVIINADTEV